MAENGEATNPRAEEAPDNKGDKASPSAAPPPPPAAASNSVSLNIWPPSQQTRKAVIQHLIETLSSPSVLSKRYGVVPVDEASATARRIEKEALAAAAASLGKGQATSVDEEVEVVQIYSKEVSMRVIEAVKERGSSASSPAIVLNGTADVTPVNAASAAGADEEASSLEAEPPQT